MSNLPPPPPPPPSSPASQPAPPTADAVAVAGITTPIEGPVMVEAAGVTKSFGNVVAVSDVTFQVGAGVTALLGPNGAGKSTLFRMLCGLTPPTRGTVRVLGQDARREKVVRGRIGLAPQQDALFDRLTAHEFVRFAGETHALSGAALAAAVTESLSHVDLADQTTKIVGSFSKGMRQRVKLAAALVNDPDVLILDEPLTGLDPVQRNRMIDLFHNLAERGKCILVSSHVLDEVARLGSNVLVISQGRLAASGDYRDLRELMDDRPHRSRLRTDEPRRVAAALIERGVATSVEVASTAVVASTLDVDRLGREAAPIAVEHGAQLNELVPLDDDLESVFRYLVERRR